MATTPIYQGDTVLLELEREQRLREKLEQRRLELVRQAESVEKLLNQLDKAEKDGTDSVDNRNYRRPN
jgi:hypothetical protein